jgi:hypothetical protein
VAGVAAAVASARGGAKTALVERFGVLGGLATMGLVSPVGSLHTHREQERYGGILDEIFDELLILSKKYAGGNRDRGASPYIALDDCVSPEILKYVLLEKATRSGVKLMLQTTVISASSEDGMVKSIILSDKSGIKSVTAKVFIDASGDADLAFHAGAEYVYGSEPGVMDALFETGLDTVHDEAEETRKYEGYSSSGEVQPVSSMFFMGGVDTEKSAKFVNQTLKYEDLGIDREEYKKLFYYGWDGFEENGDLIPLPQGRVLWFYSSREGEVIVNMSRATGINGTKAEDVTKGEIIVQKQIIAIADFLIRYVPGFEKAYLINSSNILGVRESRRIIGMKTLKGIDAINCERPPDSVAYGSYSIDIHDPTGRRKAVGGCLKGPCYGIPIGCLISKNLPNLLAAGRCISADHVAHSSTRIEGTCILTGQAAGTLAALAAAKHKTPDKIPAEDVRKRLEADGVVIY